MKKTSSKKPLSRSVLRGYCTSYLFILPAMIYFAIFSFAPIIYMVYLSFTEYKFPGTPHFNGLSNFIKASKDTLYWQSVWNTLVFTFFATIFTVVFALIIAVFMNRKFKGKRVFRVIYYLPAVVSEVVNAILFLWLFNAQFGVINTTLMKIGIKNPIAWLQTSPYAMIVIILVAVWRGGCWNAPIFLSALEGISKSIYESAEIDGANGWVKFWKISLPSLNDTMVYVVIMTIIAGFQVIAYCDVLTNGAPFNTTLVSIKYIWKQAFEFNNMGYASTLSLILFPALMVVTYFQVRGSDKRGDN